jgi:uncharacterized membrane protein YqjE
MADVKDRPDATAGSPGRRTGPGPERAAAALSTAELIKEITSQFGHLAKKQLELAKTELRADVRAEVAMAEGLGVGAIAALLTVNMLLVTLVLALAQRMPGWGAGLAVSGFLLGVAIIAALVGWQKRVRSPLARTRRTLQEDYGALRPSHAQDEGAAGGGGRGRGRVRPEVPVGDGKKPGEAVVVPGDKARLGKERVV